MNLNDISTAINTIASLSIVLMLIFFSKEKRKHKFAVAFVAWIFVSLYGAIVITTLTGDYLNHRWIETLINTSIALMIAYIRGNLAILFQALKYTKELRLKEELQINTKTNNKG